ncbi:MAG: TlpA disulfide reductase family protein [Caldilineaceae bacterium]
MSDASSLSESVETEASSLAEPAAPTQQMTPQNMSRQTTLWRFAIFAVLLVFIGFLAVGLRNMNRSGGRPTGQAPDFEITTFEGETIRLSELRGKRVVINFWASWCIPCRSEAPILESASQRYSDKDVVFLGLDYLDQDHKAKEFLKEFGVSYPNGPDLQSDAARNYGITGVPETFFVGPDGNITGNKIGEIRSEAELNEFLSQASSQ